MYLFEDYQVILQQEKNHFNLILQLLRNFFQNFIAMSSNDYIANGLIFVHNFVSLHLLIIGEDYQNLELIFNQDMVLEFLIKNLFFGLKNFLLISFQKLSERLKFKHLFIGLIISQERLILRNSNLIKKQ